MRILLIGGPKFVGRHFIEAALARGHQVTLFNRGQTHAQLYPELERIRGDRDGGLDALRGRSWDTVLDTCGYVPRLVGASARYLADHVEHYTFVSSLSVYGDTRQPGLDETAPVGRLEDESVEQITGETYGPLKALCEQAAEAAMPGRVLHVRAGLIVGPYDPTDRFTYWPVRVQRGGAILAPGSPGSQVQFVDVRDLAIWMVQMAEARRTGVFNATGPAEALSMGAFLEHCQLVSGTPSQLVWTDEARLLELGLAPWVELPLWIPESDPQSPGFSTFDCRKARAAGLAFRPLAATIQATLEWAATRPADHAWRAGLTPDREALALPTPPLDV